MQAVLLVTVPFFALVLCGYLAAHRHVLPESAIPGLNAFVLYFALPCMLFKFGASTPVLELLNPDILLVYGGCALLLTLFVVGMSLNRRVRMKDAAFGALVAAFPNTGFMGVPLLVALLGHAAAGPMICTILVDVFLTSSLCIALSQLGGKTGSGGAWAAARRALKGTVSNPLPWSIALGAAFSALGYELLGPVQTVVDMLASAASPVALFTIGAVLWRAGQHAGKQTRKRDYIPVAVVKLVLHPLLVLVMSLAARQWGLSLSLAQITVMVLTAALPSASNVALLAERYGADNGRVTRIIMTSTVLAFGSFTAMAWLFGAQPG